MIKSRCKFDKNRNRKSISLNSAKVLKLNTKTQSFKYHGTIEGDFLQDSTADTFHKIIHTIFQIKRKP